MGHGGEDRPGECVYRHARSHKGSPLSDNSVGIDFNEPVYIKPNFGRYPKEGRRNKSMAHFTELDFGINLAKEVAEGYQRFWDKNKLTVIHEDGRVRIVRTDVPRTRPSAEFDFGRYKKRKSEDYR